MQLVRRYDLDLLDVLDSDRPERLLHVVEVIGIVVEIPLGTELARDVAGQRAVHLRIQRQLHRKVPFDVEGVRVAGDHRQPQDQLAERTFDGFDLEIRGAHDETGDWSRARSLAGGRGIEPRWPVLETSLIPDRNPGGPD